MSRGSPARGAGHGTRPGDRHHRFTSFGKAVSGMGVNSVTAGDTSIVIGGTATDPTVATGTLDVIAADHPPAASWSNNSKKITSLANGSGAQDAAAFGQIPTSASQIGGVTSVTATDTSIVVGGTAAAPTVATATLDVIAAVHAAVADWSNNSHKITSLANGSAAQDAAAFGQTLAGGNGNPLTTKGDLLTMSAAPAPARLAIGSATQLLGVSSGLPAWASADATATHILGAGTQSAGANGQWTDSGHVHPADGWTPADYGLLACTCSDPAIGQSTQLLVAGTVYLCRINIRAPITATNIVWFVTTAGSNTGGSTGTFTGIYNSAGTLLSGSADVAASLTSSGQKSLALTTPQSLSAGSFYWIAIVCNLGTTQPTFSKLSASLSVIDGGQSAATFRAAVNGTVQTSLPSPITPSSNTNTGAFLFVGGIS